MANKSKSILESFLMPPEMADFLAQKHRDAVHSPKQWWETANRLKTAAGIVLVRAERAIERQSARFAQQRNDRENGGERIIVSTPSPEEGQRFLQDYFEGTMLNVALMLFGMAFECLIKGVLISRSDGAVWKNGQFIPPFGHYLPDAAKEVLGDLDVRQMELLKILSECIFWRGRYPVDRQPSIAGPIVALSSEFGSYQWYGMDSRYNDRELLGELYQQLERSIITEVNAHLQKSDPSA